MSATIRIGMSTSDLAAGAEATFKAAKAYLDEHEVSATLKRTGSLGASHREPTLEITSAGEEPILYGRNELGNQHLHRTVQSLTGSNRHGGRSG